MHQSRLSFYSIALLMGLVGSFLFPTISLFLQTELHLPPIQIGFFVTSTAISGVIITQVIAYFSDGNVDRRAIMIGCHILAVISCVNFAFVREFWWLYVVAITLYSFASAGFPQLYAIAKEFSEQTNNQTTADRFNAVIRTQIAIAWVLGPPLGFLLIGEFGFTFLYAVSGILFFALIFLTWFLLPKLTVSTNKDRSKSKQLYKNPWIWLVFIAFLVGQSANNMYLISMPLFMHNELQFPIRISGLLMGTAALIEIPFMLSCTYFALRFNKRLLIQVAVLCGGLFYLGMYFYGRWVQTQDIDFSLQTGLIAQIKNIPLIVTPFFALQLLNAIFIAFTAALGIAYFLQLMPNTPGQAAGMLANAIKTGSIMAGVFSGFIAHYWQYQTVFIACAVCCFLSVLLLSVVNERKATIL